MKTRLWLIAHAVALLGFYSTLGSQAQTIYFDPAPHTTGKFDGCPPEGNGSDPYLNRLKNRDLPPPSFSIVGLKTVFTKLPSDLPTRKDRDTWTDADRQRVAEWEKKGVSIQGYLLKAKQEGEERCNCQSTSHKDFHLWFGKAPLDKHASVDQRSESMVVEISPRLIPQHATWTSLRLNQLADHGTRIRISGWLMFDGEHPEQIGKTRGTLWEIHPIHKIEMYMDGKWEEMK